MRVNATTHRTLPFLALLVAFAPGCGKDKVNGDGSGTPRDGGAAVDREEIVCRRPPTIHSPYCDPPPFGVCKDTYMCHGCNCSGGMKIAACDPRIGDCRWFCTGCYPETYEFCGPGASPNTLGLCGYCFSDAGAGKCDKMAAILDMKVAGPADAGAGKQ